MVHMLLALSSTERAILKSPDANEGELGLTGMPGSGFFPN